MRARTAAAAWLATCPATFSDAGLKSPQTHKNLLSIGARRAGDASEGVGSGKKAASVRDEFMQKAAWVPETLDGWGKLIFKYIYTLHVILVME